MKKALLSVAVVAASVMTGMANEYKFVFDGDNDMGGLTRQTSTKESELTFTESFNLNEEGVELSIKKTSEKGIGFALINAGGTNAGLCVFSSFTVPITPEISLTVPNGKITSVTLTMSGTGVNSLDIPFNGTEVEPEYENSLATWIWNDPEGTENVKLTWANNYYLRYIHSINVVYTPDLGGKKECELSFGTSSYQAVLGETVNYPMLINPNNLSIAWSSSDEKVAVVDNEGKVTLLAGGKTTITASTEGNDEFAAGNAKYELEVIPAASNISELLEYAPDVYDKVKVNFPLTVNFANGSMAYVTDTEGNATCVDDIRNRDSSSTSSVTIYKIGQVIPAGWIATNATIYESRIWEGLPGEVTETVTVEYPTVESVEPSDADRVVTLMNVTFESRTAEGNTKAYGTTPDGTRYEFQDTYYVQSKPAGTYDVTCVVKYSKVKTTEYFYLAPISYKESTPTKLDTIGIKDTDASYYDLSGKRTINPKSGVYVKVVNNKATKIIVK